MKPISITVDYSIRPIEEKDLKQILEWRNSEKVHSQMLTDHKITWDEHYGWFKRMKEQTVIRNFVFEYRGVPVGYIGYTEYDEENHSCSPGAYLGIDIEAPNDAAICLFYTSIEYAFKFLGMLKLNTDVFADNIRALKLDKFLGYEIIKEQEHYVLKDGKKKLTYRLEIDKARWLNHKKILQKYLCLE